MIVQCDKCRTKFRIADERVSDKGVKVRCSRCAHVFVVRKQPNETARLNPSQLMSLAAQTQPPGGSEAPTGATAIPSSAPRSPPPPATTEQAALALGFAGDRAPTEVLPKPEGEAVTVQTKLPAGAGEDVTWGADPGQSTSLDLDGMFSSDVAPANGSAPPAPSAPGPSSGIGPTSGIGPSSGIGPTSGIGPSSGIGAAPLSSPTSQPNGIPIGGPSSGFEAAPLGPASSPTAAPLSGPTSALGEDPLGGSMSSLDLSSDDIGDRFPPPPEGGFGGPPPPPPPSSDVAPPEDVPAFAPPPPPEGLPQTLASGGAYQFGGSHDFFESVDGGDIPGLLPPEALGDDDPFGGQDAPPPEPPPAPVSDPPPELMPSGVNAPTPTAPFADAGGMPLARIDLGKAAVPNLSDGTANMETTAIAAAYEEQVEEPVRRELPQVGERTGLWPSLVGALVGVAIVGFAWPDIGAGLVERFSRRGADVLARVSRANVLPDSLADVRALDTHVTAYPVSGGQQVLVVRGSARNVGAAALDAPTAVVLAMNGDEVVARAEAPTGVVLDPDVLTGTEPAGLRAAFDAHAATVEEKRIPPGGEWPFMVVFTEAPDAPRDLLFVTEFRARAEAAPTPDPEPETK